MAKNDVERSGRTIQAVEIAFNIIDCLQANGVTGVTELAAELDHSKSTIHSHLQTLEQRQIVVREDEGYRLSLRILEMSTRVREQIGNPEVIQEEVNMLAEETGEIAQFGIEEHGKISYFHKQTGDLGVETASRVGAQQPIYSTSLGKAILAYLPADRTDQIISNIEFEKSTSNTITSVDELQAELQQIRGQGYGIDDEENINGLRCVAAPVKNEETVLGAISVSGPSSRVSLDRIHEELSEKVQRAANVIELNTKFG